MWCAGVAGCLRRRLCSVPSYTVMPKLGHLVASCDLDDEEAVRNCQAYLLFYSQRQLLGQR